MEHRLKPSYLIFNFSGVSADIPFNNQEPSVTECRVHIEAALKSAQPTSPQTTASGKYLF